MTYEELKRYGNKSIESMKLMYMMFDIFENIILYGLINDEKLMEFNYCIKNMNPYMKPSSSRFHDFYKKDASYFVKKVNEIARYFKVGPDDILRKNEDFKLDSLLVHKLFEDTMNKKIEWFRQKGGYFESKDIHFSDQRSEKIVLSPFYTISYYASCRIKKTVVNTDKFIDGSMIYAPDGMINELEKLYNYVDKVASNYE